MSLAQVAMSFIDGLSQGTIDQAKTNASNIVGEANAYAANLVRTSNNNLSKSRASLARYNQSENNSRVLKNTGSAVETAGINYRRARDNAELDDVEAQIAFAEQMGNQRAQAALSGLTGGVADLVNATTRLRQNRLQQRRDEALRLGDYDAGQQQKHIYETGWDSLDSSEVVADVDYSTNIVNRATYAGTFFTEAFGKVSAKDLAEAGSSFNKEFIK